MAKHKKELEVPAEIADQEVVLLDEADPRSLINMVPQHFKDAILNIAKNYPEYLTLPEYDLKKLLEPDDTDDEIRVAFWHEYVRAQDAGNKIRLITAFSNFCSDHYFYHKMITNPKKVAWIICRPAHYMMSLEASLDNGRRSIKKIMAMKIFDDNGNIKPKEAGIFLKAYEMLDNRVRGSVIQRIEQKSVHYRADDADKASDELKRLREKQGAIDVTPKSEG